MAGLGRVFAPGKTKRLCNRWGILRTLFPSGYVRLLTGSAQRGFVWLAAGKATAVVANAALLIAAARLLEVGDFGLFSTAAGAQLFISRILIAGMESGVIRLSTAPGLKTRQQEVLAAGVNIIAGGSLALAALAFLAVPALQAAGTAWLPGAVVLGGAGLALSDYAAACRLSSMRYSLAALVQSGAPAVRLVTTLGVAAVWKAALPVVLAFTAGSLAYGLLQVALLNVRASVDRKLYRQVLSFTAGIAVSDVLVGLSLHQGSFLLLFMSNKVELGLYGLVLSITLGGRAIAQAFSTSLLPRMARLEGVAALPSFVRRSLLPALGLSAAGVPAAMAAAWLLPRLSRPEYARAVPALYWLTASVLVSVLQAPFVAGALYLLRPGLLVTVNVLRVAAIAAFGVVLAPGWGAGGAAFAQFAGSALSSATLALMVIRETRAAIRTKAPGGGPAFGEIATA